MQNKVNYVAMYAKQVNALQQLLLLQQHYAAQQQCASTQTMLRVLNVSIKSCKSKLRYYVQKLVFTV